MAKVVDLFKALTFEHTSPHARLTGPPTNRPRMAGRLVDGLISDDPVLRLDRAIEALMAVKGQISDARLEMDA